VIFQICRNGRHLRLEFWFGESLSWTPGGSPPSLSFPSKKAATIINAITTQSFKIYAVRLSSIRVREVHGELTR
jgi:hypothetical protein